MCGFGGIYSLVVKSVSLGSMCGLGVLLIVAERELCGRCGKRVRGVVGVNGSVRGREALVFCG